MRTVPPISQRRPDLEDIIRAKQRSLRVKAGLPADETRWERLAFWWKCSRLRDLLDGVFETVFVMALLLLFGVPLLFFATLAIFHTCRSLCQ